MNVLNTLKERSAALMLVMVCLIISINYYDTILIVLL